MPETSLADATVLDPDGKVVALRSTYDDRPAVLVFLRHFGWLHCAQQAAEFRAHQSDIEKKGARLVLIGNGSAAQAKYFRTEVLRLPEQPAAGEPLLYTDPSLATFRAAGLKHGKLRTFSPKAIGATVSAVRAGFRQGKTMGEPWQQGGALVLAKGGEVKWSYASDDPGDHAPVHQALAALP